MPRNSNLKQPSKFQIPEQQQQYTFLSIVFQQMENKYLTPKCNHNERGRCINCLSKKLRQEKLAQQKGQGPQPAVMIKKPSQPVVNRCNHGPKAKCINCLTKQNLLQGKCDHGPFVKCPMCINKEQYTNFKYYLSRLEQDCAHKKPCSRCVPPQVLYYFINKNCRNHLPYPQAMCNACLPPTVTIKKQTYQHVREVCFKTFDVYRFTDLRDRFAVLYGKETVTGDGVVVEVNALYFPKQRFEKEFEIFEGEFEEKLQVLAETMGIKKVGIMFDSVELTHQHLLLSAHYQDINKDVESGIPISRFITVRLARHPETGQTQGIQCYMVSDQFQAFQKNSLVYKIPGLNEFGLQVAVDKTDNLPTYLREGIETDRLAFEEALVWIQCSNEEMADSLTPYPFFNIQQTNLDDVLNYLMIHSTLQPPERYRHNFQFLLDVADRMGLQPCLQLCLCDSQQDLAQAQKRIQVFAQQQKSNAVLQQHRQQSKPQHLIQSRLKQQSMRQQQILREQEQIWMKQIKEQDWLQQQMMDPAFLREQKELMKIQEREERRRREQLNRHKEEQLRRQQKQDKKSREEARQQQIQQQYLYQQHIKEQHRLAEEQRRRQMQSQQPQPVPPPPPYTNKPAYQPQSNYGPYPPGYNPPQKPSSKQPPK